MSYERMALAEATTKAQMQFVKNVFKGREVPGKGIARFAEHLNVCFEELWFELYDHEMGEDEPDFSYLATYPVIVFEGGKYSVEYRKPCIDWWIRSRE